MILWHTDNDMFEPGQWVKGNVQAFTMTSDGKYAAIGIMGARSRLHSWEDSQMRVVCRPPYFTALELIIGGLCVTALTILPGDLLYFDGSFSNHLASNECPLRRAPSAAWETVVQSNYTLLEHDYKIDAINGPATGVDQQGRTIQMRDGKVFRVDDEGQELLFDANLYSFENVVPPDWATQW